MSIAFDTLTFRATVFIDLSLKFSKRNGGGPG